MERYAKGASNSFQLEESALHTLKHLSRATFGLGFRALQDGRMMRFQSLASFIRSPEQAQEHEGTVLK